MSPSRSQSLGTYTVNSPNSKPLLHTSLSLPVKKTVSFGSADHICTIEKISDLPEAVVADLWWSAREYTEIRKEYEAVLFLLDTGKPVPEEEHSSRGLHNRTEEGAWTLYENQRNARNAVLLQQDIQRKNKVKDPLEIAKAYLKESVKMRDAALLQAVSDAVESSSSEPRLFASQHISRQAKGHKARAPTVFNDSFAHLGAFKSVCTASTENEDASKQANSHKVVLFRNLSSDDSIEVLAKSSNKDASGATVCPYHVPEKVRFSKKKKIIKSRKVNDLEKDKKKRWYCKKELQKIEFGFGAVIELMEKGIELGDNVEEEEKGETRRGLEKSTEDGAWKLYERRRDALNAVLVLQEQQRKDRCVDPDVLATAYSTATKEACKEAVKFGKQDAREAKKYRLRRRSTPSQPRLKKSDEEVENNMAHSTDESGDEQVVTIKVNKTNNNTTCYSRRVSFNDVAEKAGDFATSAEDETDFGDLSGRSLLSLDYVHKPTEVPIERCTLRRRLSSSHAPSRLFVLANATENKKEVKDHSTSSKKSKPESVTWARRKSKSTADADPSESASAYEEIVTEIVVSSHIPEPKDDDVALAVVLHVFAAQSSYRENESKPPVRATDMINANDLTTTGAVEGNASPLLGAAVGNNTLVGFPAESFSKNESSSAALSGKIDRIAVPDTDQRTTDRVSKSIVTVPDVEAVDPPNPNDKTGELGSPASIVNDNSKCTNDFLADEETLANQKGRVVSNKSEGGLDDCDTTSSKSAEAASLTLPEGIVTDTSVASISSRSAYIVPVSDLPCSEVISLPIPVEEVKPKDAGNVVAVVESEAVADVPEVAISKVPSMDSESASTPEQLPNAYGTTTGKCADMENADVAFDAPIEGLDMKPGCKTDPHLATEAFNCDCLSDDTKDAADVHDSVDGDCLGGNVRVVAAVTSEVPTECMECNVDPQSLAESEVDGNFIDTLPTFTEPLPVQAAPFSYLDNPGRADQERVEELEDVKSKCSTVSTRDLTKSPSVVDTDTNDAADNNEDAVVWFKVRAKDVVTIQLEDGRSVYLLDNAENCTEEGAWDQWM
jgi:hypothetical protein